MIENELRLGNWIFGHNPYTMEPNETGQFQVVEISEIGINFKKVDLSRSDWACDVEPIQLTTDILQKCGFRNDHGNGDLWWERPDTEDFGLLEAEIPEEEEFHFLFEHSRLSIDIKYLHQLQNLYFALTAQEINYQP